MLPLGRRQNARIREELFAELTCHAAYDPQRAICTNCHKLIRPFGEHLETVLPNVDDSPSKSLLIEAGWGSHRRPRVEFYDLVMDPGEMCNLADSPDYSDVRGDLEHRLHEWMVQTDDPLLQGPVPLPPGAYVDDRQKSSCSTFPQYVGTTAATRNETRCADERTTRVPPGAR